MAFVMGAQQPRSVKTLKDPAVNPYEGQEVAVHIPEQKQTQTPAPPAAPTKQQMNMDIANGIANGTLTGKGVSDAYGKMAAGKMDELQQQGSFNYDFNRDPMFKVLSQRYQAEAKKAANNANAMAAARTGGYGNSYGAAAASQQYHNAMGNLYDQVPELQEAAYQRYLNDRNDLYRQAEYYNDLGETARGWDWKEREAAREQANYDRDDEFRRTEADREDARWNKNFDYGREQDALAQENWQKQFDYGREQDALNHAEDGAQYLASLGFYDAAEQLYGVDLGVANETDAFNRAMKIITTTGMTSDEALTFLKKYLGVDGLEGIFGSGSGGSGGSGGGGGGKKGGGSKGSSGGEVPTYQEAPAQPTATSGATELETTPDEFRKWFGNYYTRR